MEAKESKILISKKEKIIDGVNEEHFHVLAVDDSVIERKMLEKLLTISSYHVTCVESGDKALEFLGLLKCQSHPVVLGDAHVDDHDDNEHDDDDHGDEDDDDDDDDDDMICPSLPLPDDAHHQQQGQGTRVNLIMTDYSMPGMSGYDLLKRVKESSWKDVPVIVMSSENVPSRIHMCLEEGAEEFLLKPVRLSDLKKLQPHILKSTPITSTINSCGSENMSNFVEANANSIISKDQITTTADDNEDYSSNSSEENERVETNFKNNEMEHFAKCSKFDQLVM